MEALRLDENRGPRINLLDPDEMIRANGAAEAAQTDRLKAEAEDYREAIGELRLLCEKNQELVGKLQFLNRSAAEDTRTLLEENRLKIEEKLDDLQSFDPTQLENNIRGAVSQAQRQNEERLALSDELAHKDSVRVYRNVQASMIAELARQTEDLNTRLEVLREQTAPDPKADGRARLHTGLMITLLVLQAAEGAGLLFLLWNMLH